MRRDAARGEGEIGLLGLAIGAAPAIRGLFHPYLIGETPRDITVCVRRVCPIVIVVVVVILASLPPTLFLFLDVRDRVHGRTFAIQRRGCAVSPTDMRVYITCMHTHTSEDVRA